MRDMGCTFRGLAVVTSREADATIGLIDLQLPGASDEQLEYGRQGKWAQVHMSCRQGESIEIAHDRVLAEPVSAVQQNIPHRVTHAAGLRGWNVHIHDLLQEVDLSRIGCHLGEGVTAVPCDLGRMREGTAGAGADGCAPGGGIRCAHADTNDPRQITHTENARVRNRQCVGGIDNADMAARPGNR